MHPETIIVRCSQWSCHTTINLDDDPAALQNCGHIVCDRCVSCDTCQDGAA